MNKETFSIGFIEKVGFTVTETKPYSAERLVAESIGRLVGLPEAIAVGQEKFLSYLQNPQKKDIEEKLQKFQKNKNLKDTLVRLKGTDTIDDIKRIWRNDKQGLIAKLIGTTFTPAGNLQASLTRGTSYNPYSDTANIFSKIPEYAQHEMGHAADFNNSKNKATRTAYAGARGLEYALLGTVGLQAGPVTQWQETAANREAYKAVGDDKPAWQNYRRRLWPARGTYLGALGGGVAALATGMNPVIGGAMGFPVGAAGGRILAGMKNWLENRQTRSKAYTEFLNSFGPPSLKNPESTRYTDQPSKVPQIHDIAKVYAKQRLTNQGLTPENFAAFVVTQGSNFANKWNKKNNLTSPDGMNEEMHKYRDLRHFTPAQWAEFKTYLNKSKY